MTDLDTLRPEVREAVAAIDKGNGVFVNGDDCDGGIAWATARAELLRLQSTESRANEWQLRAERAEAELAALKARIAEAPITQVTRMAAIGGGGYEWAGCRVPDAWNGKSVRVVLDE